MPTKPNKAGKQQPYVPAGHGDLSGEYAENNTGSNKNYASPDNVKRQLGYTPEKKVESSTPKDVINKLNGRNEPTPDKQRKLEQKGIVDNEVGSYELDDSDTTIIDDAIYWVKKNGLDLTVDNVIKQINEDMGGFLPDKKEPKYNAILDYIKEKGGNEDTSNNIDYENVNYPKGTSKEYTNMVNEKYQNALSTLEQLGISVKDFGGQKSQEGGYEDNTREIMEKYVFEPFRQKYPNGNNEAWKKEFEPIYNAIDAVEDKLYNDFYIKNN